MQSCCEFPLAALLVVMVLAVQSSCSSLQASALRQCKDVQLWTCILCMEGQCIRLSEFSRGRACADYTGRYARKEDVVQAENGRDGNDSMSAASEGVPVIQRR